MFCIYLIKFNPVLGEIMSVLQLCLFYRHNFFLFVCWFLGNLVLLNEMFSVFSSKLPSLFNLHLRLNGSTQIYARDSEVSWTSEEQSSWPRESPQDFHPSLAPSLLLVSHFYSGNFDPEPVTHVRTNLWWQISWIYESGVEIINDKSPDRLFSSS